MLKPRSVFVGKCGYRFIEMCSHMSTIALLFSDAQYILDYGCKPFMYIDQARNGLVRDALERPEAEWFFSTDSDNVWPGNTISRLASHGQPVVGALYFSKLEPYDCTAFNFIEGCCPVQVQRLRELPEEPTLLQVGGLGMGATLIHMDVLRRMREEYKDEKWFRSEEGGEDVWFFRRLYRMGVAVYLDTGWECGHMGEQIITRINWEECRRERATSENS